MNKYIVVNEFGAIRKSEIYADAIKLVGDCVEFYVRVKKHWVGYKFVLIGVLKLEVGHTVILVTNYRDTRENRN